jgi:hypothetical protein
MGESVMSPQETRRLFAFNSPLESGLRSLLLLIATYPRHHDLQRLLLYDYLLVHSADVPDGPQSLHPPTPHRSGEIIVRRTLVEQGLLLFCSRGLITQSFDSSGIRYQAAEMAPQFAGCLEAGYTVTLRDRAAWVAGRFDRLSDTQLTGFIRGHLDEWGAEFAFESLFRELPR